MVKNYSSLDNCVGLSLSLLQWVIFIWIWPQFMLMIWPTHIYYKQLYNFRDRTYFMLVSQIELCLIYLVGFTFYYILYRNKFAFFEKYKATQEPWPWDSDPKAWNCLFWRSVKFTLFNIFVTTPLLSAP